MLMPNSQNVVRCAKKMLRLQAFVPESPAARSIDGEVNLCLAAAVAKAGLVLSGRVFEATRFVEELARTKSKDSVRDAYLALGWSVKDCDAHMEFNDSVSNDKRKAAVLASLSSGEFGA